MRASTTPSGREQTHTPLGTPTAAQPFWRKVLISVGIVATVVLGLLLLWLASSVFLLAFLGILLAIFLRGISDWICAHTPLSSALSLALVVALLLGLFGAGVWFLAPSVAGQLDELVAQVPRIWGQLEQRVTTYRWGRALIDSLQGTETLLPSNPQLFQRAAGIFSTTIGIIITGMLLLFIGLYLAIDPGRYLSGLVCLFPQQRRRRVREVLHVLGYTLRWWLTGKLLSILVIACLTTLGLWLLGMPLALTLGLSAGLLSFIPNIGPILALAPALLIGLSQGTGQALSVFFLYIGVQIVESYLLTPIIEQKTIALPPALTLCAVALLGLLFGGLGVLLAAPLTAVAMVLVKMLYVEDILGETIEVRGEEQAIQASEGS